MREHEDRKKTPKEGPYKAFTGNISRIGMYFSDKDPMVSLVVNGELTGEEIEKFYNVIDAYGEIKEFISIDIDSYTEAETDLFVFQQEENFIYVIGLQDSVKEISNKIAEELSSIFDFDFDLDVS